MKKCPFEINVNLNVNVYFHGPPRPGVVASVTFAKDPFMPLPNLIGTVNLQPTNPADNVTSRMVEIINTTPGQPAQPPIDVDAIVTNPVTFPCLVGDTGTVTVTDSNVSGAGPISVALSYTATPGVVPIPVPAQGVVASVTFMPA